MPELPEVETTCRGITPLCVGCVINRVVVREARLRWPVNKEVARDTPGKTIQSVFRRGKYLLMGLGAHHLLVHLGMSGRLSVVPSEVPPGKHDHIDIVLADGNILRYTDPRRFGCVLLVAGDPLKHPLLSGLGPEPLGQEFSPRYLFEQSRNRSVSIKLFIMNSKVVVGVGNIYANEALFLAGIRPDRKTDSLTLDELRRLHKAICQVLKRAIRAGGTTLRDFAKVDGKPGYFQQALLVYGRGGEPCPSCKRTLTETRQGQRTTVFCESCQK